MKKISALVSTLLVLAFLLGTAGCVFTVTPPIQAEQIAVPADMQQALDNLSDDLSSNERQILADLLVLSEDIGAAKTKEEQTSLLRSCYADNPWLTAVVFHNNVDEYSVSAPFIPETILTPRFIHSTEQDFLDAGGYIVRSSVFTEYHGYVNFYYRPVYDADNNYLGHLAFVTETYAELNLQQKSIDTKRIYDDYVCFIVDKSGHILYSSAGEAIGEYVSPDGTFDGSVYIPAVGSAKGACRYTSHAFSITSTQQTEKITAWEWIYSSVKGECLVYLVKEMNPPEENIENVFTPDPKQALNDTYDALIYGYSTILNGTGELSARLMSGYYQTTLALMNTDGKILSSSEPGMNGMNSLNNRGIYGYAYVQAAIMAVNQGGGIIYYSRPTERVIHPEAAEFCIGIVLRLTGNSFIYGYLPGSKDVYLPDFAAQSDVAAVARAALKDASSSGIETVIERISNKTSEAAKWYVPNLTTDIQDFAVLDVNGTVYASALHPEIAGLSATGVTDVYGGSTIRRAIMLTKTGGGFFVDLRKNPEKEGYVDLWLLSILPVDEKYFISSGAVVGTFEDLLTPYLDSFAPVRSATIEY